MSGPDPQREPKSENPEKKGILKSHEEFIGDEARPSVSKSEYEKAKREKESPFRRPPSGTD